MDSQHSSFQFSQRALQLTSSAIREILKVTTRPEVISFAGGLPSPEGFPVEQLQQAFDRVLATQGRAALQYGPTEGDRKSVVKGKVGEMGGELGRQRRGGG